MQVAAEEQRKRVMRDEKVEEGWRKGKKGGRPEMIAKPKQKKMKQMDEEIFSGASVGLKASREGGGERRRGRSCLGSGE